MNAKQSHEQAIAPIDIEHVAHFDLKGWVCIPGVLNSDTCAEMREYIQRIVQDPDSFEDHERNAYSGPLQKLLDHPTLVGAMSEFLEPAQSYIERDSYPFRCEGAGIMYRPYGEEHPLLPHSGPANPCYSYRYERGRIYSGLTRIVWEINPVAKGDGATSFISGSHKSNFKHVYHRQIDKDSEMLESYECPEGSLVIFSENTIHCGVRRKQKAYPRLGVIAAYNTFISQWHRCHVPPEAIASMPKRRKTLFRGVWGSDFETEKGDPKHHNTFFDESNISNGISMGT